MLSSACLCPRFSWTEAAQQGYGSSCPQRSSLTMTKSNHAQYEIVCLPTSKIVWTEARRQWAISAACAISAHCCLHLWLARSFSTCNNSHFAFKTAGHEPSFSELLGMLFPPFWEMIVVPLEPHVEEESRSLLLDLLKELEFFLKCNSMPEYVAAS